MVKKKFRHVVIFIVILGLMAIFSGCNLPGTISSNVDDIVAQTMTALSIQAVASSNETAVTPEPQGAEILTPMTPPENTAAPVIHVIMPGEMQTIESTVDDIKYNGDDFNIEMYERPFTETQMESRFDLDLQKIDMSTDNTFFYFSLDLKDVNIDTKTMDGNYGIEFDIDKDGRGDYLLWAYQPPVSISWDYLGIALFSDNNKDVGGTRAMVSDPLNPAWNGYETEVWPGKPLTDPDGAWMRISPGDATIVQLAVKRSLVGNPTSFLWGSWTDDQIKASYKFDYNDFYTAAEAGSPYAANPNYPLKALSQMDNTCREAWGFKPTGNEPGICKQTVVQATAKPKNTSKPGVTPTKTPVTPTKQVITLTEPPTCLNGMIVAWVSPWNAAWTSSVTFCVNGDCKNPRADDGGADWLVPPGVYTITASAPAFGISPSSVETRIECDKKEHNYFTLGPG